MEPDWEPQGVPDHSARGQRGRWEPSVGALRNFAKVRVAGSNPALFRSRSEGSFWGRDKGVEP